jgi:hypothetical protein
MLNLDTHILLHALGDTVTPRERRLLSGEQWSISAIVLWEIAKLVQLGRVEIDLESQAFIRAVARLHVWPLDLSVCRTSSCAQPVASTAWAGRRSCRGMVACRQYHRRRKGEETMDEDLAVMTREQLIEEVKKLRNGIRRHRDSSGHELCWHHPALWGLLPDKTDPLPVVPEWPEFIHGCVAYRQSLDVQVPHAPRSKERYEK